MDTIKLQKKQRWKLQSKVSEEKQQKKKFTLGWSLQKKTCRMQIGCTIPLKTVMFYMEQCPFEQQQTVLAQVHELYKTKKKQKNKRE